MKSISEVIKFIRTTKLNCAYKLILLDIIIRMHCIDCKFDLDITRDYFLEFYNLRKENGLILDRMDFNCNPEQDGDKSAVLILFKKNPLRILRENGILKDYDELTREFSNILDGNEKLLIDLIQKELKKYYIQNLNDKPEVIENLLNKWNNRLSAPDIKINLSKSKYTNFINDFRKSINRDVIVYLIAKYFNMDQQNFMSFGNSEFIKFFENYKFKDESNFITLHDEGIWDGNSGLYRHSLQRNNYTCTQDSTYQEHCVLKEKCSDYSECRNRDNKIWKKNKSKMVAFTAEYLNNFLTKVLDSNKIDLEKLLIVLYGQQKFNFSEIISNEEVEFIISPELINQFRIDLNLKNDLEFNKLFIYPSFPFKIFFNKDTKSPQIEEKLENIDNMLNNLSLINYLKRKMNIY